MASNTRIRIYLKIGDTLYNFMWADESGDGSVYMGLYGISFKSSIEKIFDDSGELLPGGGFENIDVNNKNTDTKISFHQSGRYKLANEIKTTSIDRLTIDGNPLREIDKPTRMLEILIPKNLHVAKKTPRKNRDVVIDLEGFPGSPLRCTISCVPKNIAKNFTKGQTFVDTSVIENSIVLDGSINTWVWTVRVSENDKQASEYKYYFFVFGQVVLDE